MIGLVRAYAVWGAWKVGLRRYCTPCDEIYCGWRPGGHRRHHCGFFRVLLATAQEKGMGR